MPDKIAREDTDVKPIDLDGLFDEKLAVYMEENKGRIHLSRILFGLLVLFSAGVWAACIGLTLFH